jgi:TonB family protein
MKNGWLLTALFVAMPVCAQQAAADRHEETRKLLKLTRATEQVKIVQDAINLKVAPTIASDLLAGFQRDPQYANLDPGANGALAAFVFDESRKGLTAEALVDLLVPIYEKHFTPEEVRELIRFYESPIGAKLAATTPALFTDVVQGGARLGRDATAARVQAPEFMQKVYLILKQYSKSGGPESQATNQPPQLHLVLGDGVPMALDPKGFQKLPSGQIRMSGTLAMHLPFRRPACPTYPPLGRQARVEGTVRVQAVIGKDGHVIHEDLISGHPLLVSQAKECIQQWVFQPMTINGDPVEVVTELEMSFTLPK